ncbi:MAG: hypothetical protein RL318_1927 [Fibrobacterota bacterium]
MNALMALITSLHASPVDSAAPRIEMTDSVKASAAPDSSLPDTASATGDTALSVPQRRGDGVFVGKTTVVKGTRILHRQKEASKQVISGEDARKVVATMGDPMRAVNTLPGVAVESDFSVRPVVRGGKPEETRVFLDGVALLQPWHFTASASVFHPEATGQMELHTGTFPVEGAGSLSGALYVQSRPAPVDSLRGVAELSLLKGSLYLGFPVVKGQAGAYVAGQTFWYDFMFKRMLDISTVLGADSKEVDEVQESVTLPTFRDLQWGVDARLNPALSLHYTGYWGRDVFLVQQKSSYWKTTDGHLVSQWEADYRDLEADEVKLYDTSAIVDVNNHVHSLRLPWEISSDLTLVPGLAWQRQTWQVAFPDTRSEERTDWGYEYVKRPSQDEYRLEHQALDAQLELQSRAWSDHQVSLGIGLRRDEQSFHTKLARPLAEFLVKGSRNLSDMMGLYDPRGYVLTSNGSLQSSSDYAAEDMLDGLRYDYDGTQERLDAALWAGDIWDVNRDLRLRGGMRLERDGGDGSLFPSPRGSAQWKLGDRDELTVSTGLYSQSNDDFELRIRNPDLASEKAFHGGVEWSHDFDRAWRFELQGFAKSYWDLAAPSVVVLPVDWNDVRYRDIWNSQVDSSLLRRIDSLRSGRNTAGLEALYAAMTPAEKAQMDVLFGNRAYRYANTGSGFALGTEASVSYDPVAWWRGWISSGLSMSRRRDRDGDPLYPFAQDRPWTFHWVNSFRMPSRYTLDVHYGAWAGLPWTWWNDDRNCHSDPKSGWTCSDTVLSVGPRNGRRFAGYQRLDIRISKESRFFGFPSRTWFEVWNALNAPNSLLRDSETERVEMVDLNVPIPIVFLGWEVRF